MPEARPSLYPYRMTDTLGRATTGRHRGARHGASRAEDDDVLPHEQTLPKPKSDRLDLLRATRANLSPIWGLSMAAGVTATFDPTDDEPVPDAYDDDGVRHQLWVLSDPDTVEAVGTAVASRPGRPGRRPPPLRDGPGLPGRVPPGQGGVAGPHDLVMALLVELAEDQLTRRRHPPHRSPGCPRASTWSARSAMVRRRPGGSGRRPDPRRAPRLARPGPGHRRAGLPAPAPCRDPEQDGERPRLRPHRLGPRRATDSRGDAPPHRGRGDQALATWRGPGGLPAPPGDGGADRGVGPRPPADAAEDHLFQPQAPDRAWSSARSTSPEVTRARLGDRPHGCTARARLGPGERRHADRELQPRDLRGRVDRGRHAGRRSEPDSGAM